MGMDCFNVWGQKEGLRYAVSPNSAAAKTAVMIWAMGTERSFKAMVSFLESTGGADAKVIILWRKRR
jgi:hypothetical protein